MPKVENCQICKPFLWIASLPLRIFRRIYLVIFARPRMQSLNDYILNLALNGKGFNNCCNPKLTGEYLMIKNLSKLKPNLCIDIGANKGNYSRLLLEQTNANVLAFEPLPKAYAELEKLKKMYPTRFSAVNIGVGDKNTSLEINYGDEDSELASFSTEANLINYVGESNVNKLMVNILTLDDYFNRAKVSTEFSEIDLLKIDTEGYEFEVLSGAQNTIKKFRPKHIQIEYNLHQLFKAQSLYKLSTLLNGYTPFQMLPYGSGLIRVNPKYASANYFHYSNFLFIRDDLLKNLI
jgi:FkbM family methyltransferase